MSDSDKITVGKYLVERLVQLGVKTMFGVPGDFNLGFLDIVDDHPGIKWVGNCNELNASYAADGYARIKEHSIGVLTTTFGVGELSAINGIAGAFSEQVPVLHIAGVPSTTQFKTKPILHHTLGDGRFDAYTKAAAQVTFAQTTLTNVETAAADIDRLLSICINKARPVYLALPTDIAYAKISSTPLQKPLEFGTPENNPAAEKYVLEEIERQILAAKEDVVVLVDACAVRHRIRDELKEFLEKTGFPVYAAPMGKSIVDESYERYGGIYVGSLSTDEIKSKVEGAKLILSIGSLKSDFNTGNFTYKIPEERTIELHSTHTQIQYAFFHDVGMKNLLPKLTSRLTHFAPDAKLMPVPKFTAEIPNDPSDQITHDWFWPRVGKFTKPKDVIVAETGTSMFGIMDIPSPEGAVNVSQVLWGSIGWATGSTLGCAVAARESGLNRTILFTGDGSIQLTAQEVATMLRQKLTPILFILNNDGYTIERYLNGWEREYNDISTWNWPLLLSALGGKEGVNCQSYTVRTKTELSKLLDNEEFAKAEKLQLVEVMMDKFDAPKALKGEAALSVKANKYTS